MSPADPYVKVCIMYNDNYRLFKWKSSVKHKTLHAVYEESFSYKLEEEMNMDIDSISLLFYVVNHGHFWDDVIGVVDIGRNASSKLGEKHWTRVMQSSRQRISFWHSIQPATSSHMKRYRSRSRSNSPVNARSRSRSRSRSNTPMP